MPRVDGFQFARAFRELPACGAVPVVAAERALDPGAQGPGPGGGDRALPAEAGRPGPVESACSRRRHEGGRRRPSAGAGGRPAAEALRGGPPSPPDPEAPVRMGRPRGDSSQGREDGRACAVLCLCGG